MANPTQPNTNGTPPGASKGGPQTIWTRFSDWLNSRNAEKERRSTAEKVVRKASKRSFMKYLIIFSAAAAIIYNNSGLAKKEAYHNSKEYRKNKEHNAATEANTKILPSNYEMSDSDIEKLRQNTEDYMKTHKKGQFTTNKNDVTAKPESRREYNKKAERNYQVKQDTSLKSSNRLLLK